MTIAVTPITLAQLTEAQVAGTGVFDVLMRSVNAQLELEFKAGRIKGAEYATVYLGSMQSVLQTSLQFLLQRDKATLEAELVKAQVLQATAQTALVDQQIAQSVKQAALLEQQRVNLADELATAVKQRAKLDQEVTNLTSVKALTDAQAAQSTQQTTNLVSEKASIDAKTLLTTQQKDNAIIEGTVLTATTCKLQAEYDNLLAMKLKTDKEADLLGWKTTTEKAQTLATGVDDNSVIGKQKSLYGAQTAGFTRDAEQKATKIMVDTWNTRRMTDDATMADATNMLNDATVGRAVNKMLAGVGA